MKNGNCKPCLDGPSCWPVCRGSRHEESTRRPIMTGRVSPWRYTRVAGFSVRRLKVVKRGPPYSPWRQIWAWRLNKSDISSLDFVVSRFFMKMFKTNNMEIDRTCQEHFRFRLPSDPVARAQINLNLANLYDCNYRIDFAAYLS